MPRLLSDALFDKLEHLRVQIDVVFQLAETVTFLRFHNIRLRGIAGAS
jgi:hypothetical protein